MQLKGPTSAARVFSFETFFVIARMRPEAADAR
jgi:hypothetical protein